VLGIRAPEWQSVDEVLALFGTKVGRARRTYRDFLLDGWNQGHRSDLTGGGLRRSRVGWQMRERVARGRERWASDERILGSGEFVRQVLARVDEGDVVESLGTGAAQERIDRIVHRVAALQGVSASAVASCCKERRVVAARAAVIHAAVVGLRIKLTDVARALGIGPSTVLRGARRGAAEIERLGARLADLLA
jgi:hypothetical protein